MEEKTQDSNSTTEQQDNRTVPVVTRGVGSGLTAGFFWFIQQPRKAEGIPLPYGKRVAPRQGENVE